MRRLLFACVAPVAVLSMLACDGTTDPDPGDPVDLSYAPCTGASDNPTWFAFQDGEGAWTRVVATSAGAFNFTMTQGRGGVAMYTAADGLFIVYATAEELRGNFPSCNGSVRSVSGEVTGYVSLDDIRLSMGVADDFFPGSNPPPAAFFLDGVDANVTDLVAVRYRISGDGANTFQAIPNNVAIRRGVTGTTAGTVDFGSTTEAGAPLQRTVTVPNMIAGEALSVTSFIALSTSAANIAVYNGAASSVSGAVSAPFYGINPSRLSSGESHVLMVNAERQVSSSTFESRFVTSVFTNPESATITLGPVLGSVTLAGGSRPSATYTAQSDYDGFFDVNFEQSGGVSFRRIEVLATRAYMGNASTITLAVPSLTGVPGFQSTWLLAAGTVTDWRFLAASGDLSVLGYKPKSYQGAERSGLFTP